MAYIPHHITYDGKLKCSYQSSIFFGLDLRETDFSAVPQNEVVCLSYVSICSKTKSQLNIIPPVLRMLQIPGDKKKSLKIQECVESLQIVCAMHACCNQVAFMFATSFRSSFEI